MPDAILRKKPADRFLFVRVEELDLQPAITCRRLKEVVRVAPIEFIQNGNSSTPWEASINKACNIFIVAEYRWRVFHVPYIYEKSKVVMLGPVFEDVTYDILWFLKCPFSVYADTETIFGR
ncbi:MAG: hypothetical protein O7D34_06015 [Ignavibacteria bacterium]|nr:hypothetical protein [Ignavibacteria bacterium]